MTVVEETSQKPQTIPEPSPLNVNVNVPVEAMDDPPSPIMEDPPTPDLPPTALPAMYDPSFGAGYPPAGGLGDMSSLFNPEMMQMFQGAAGGGSDGTSPFAPRQQVPSGPAEEKPFVVRLVPVIHMVAITVMFYLAVFVWEPSVWASGAGKSSLWTQKVGGTRAGRWRSLRGDTGVASDILTSGFASLVCPFSHGSMRLSAHMTFSRVACLLGIRDPGNPALQHGNLAGSSTSLHPHVNPIRD